VLKKNPDNLVLFLGETKVVEGDEDKGSVFTPVVWEKKIQKCIRYRESVNSSNQKMIKYFI